ncbi:cation:dicarboxylate symporter family transporter [Dermatophilus congolensis]|uniref:cation:dicarboxylate symporter family transporter n=1 Tax=Dermatophilus congolensis TaxID=1863 RepID=UPI001AAEDB12|nr:cation:dicarboxylase symporter family transporter [Dermatophilus congolensis]MBO3129555.1 cation:dicarboxylase symporter family transporter [Dermatophilus congolensis]MBO3131812.1 cation:dicarboxylase symporter family transporter [Dermatophilus congolensis]MBO3134031.1 cation:dicarboxylase symporter family transporter [Dermatophilus congolensis]MBO3136263.1 cation:dicarboxylase symporter family transporter [Dermatophilus congolensis]MBO3138510.1 cation:dicarboxylase symporter family transpo
MAHAVNEAHIVEPKKPRRDRTHWLYILVIVAVIAGIGIGLSAPEFAKSLKWLGELFVALIKMMIGPVIFCTIVLGIGSVRAAASVGKVGAIALVYFIAMSTVALGIGLLVGNVIHPGDGLTIPHTGAGAGHASKAAHAGGTIEFLRSIVPTTLVSALTQESVLQVLFVALLVGFAVQGMGKDGEPILRGVAHLQKLVFRVLSMVLWVAPIGAFGAIAAVVGSTGPKALAQLGLVMVAFYVTCVLFVVVVLGLILWAVTRLNVFQLLKYLAKEYLLIVATSSSESALPSLMGKMEHAGVSKSTVGIVVPTGYSFNLDGTAIYLTMSAVFISHAMGTPMAMGEQISLLVFMIVASKGAAGVSGAGLATLAGGLQAYRPDLVAGVDVIVGIDRFMSEARALTNFSGNAVATFLVGKWTGTLDVERARLVLAGKDPFDYSVVGVDPHDTEYSVRKPPAPIDPAAGLQPTPHPVLTDRQG